ncbi:ATP-binding cassette domain-containing protein [Actinomadura flavalba]|uniref:ATP-binding cassette domain-containing protein n=1 Tax=Actinomadura flavalba TaxID=1120938 RepID=UPI0003639584|nr:ATP-binding cassette domain-containing protein [Actinomadura flavalba]
MGSESDSRAVAVETAELELRGARGFAYRGVSLDVPAGGFTALAGIAGTGRTALLLTLGGRMRSSGGSAVVGGRRLPGDLRGVQRVSALGVVSGVTDLEPSLTVREHVSEALDLHEGLFGRWRHRRDRVRAALDRVGLDVPPKTRAQDLAPDEVQLLGAALGLVGAPGLLLLDDVDEGLPRDRQRALWERLGALAGDVTIIVTCHDPVPAEGIARIVHLSETA